MYLWNHWSFSVILHAMHTQEYEVWETDSSRGHILTDCELLPMNIKYESLTNERHWSANPRRSGCD